jgi:hypothetical protein
MFANDLPTRRISIRGGTRLQSQDNIQITLSHCNGHEYWLQVKSISINASTRSSVAIFKDNGYLIIRYLENVCGVVGFLEQSDLDICDKQEALNKVIKIMASIDYFKYAN